MIFAAATSHHPSTAATLIGSVVLIGLIAVGVLVWRRIRSHLTTETAKSLGGAVAKGYLRRSFTLGLDAKSRVEQKAVADAARRAVRQRGDGRSVMERLKAEVPNVRSDIQAAEAARAGAQREKFAAQGSAVAITATSGGAPAKIRVTAYDGQDKIHAIKAVRAAFGLDLKAAKAAVDAMPERPYEAEIPVSAVPATLRALSDGRCKFAFPDLDLEAPGPVLHPNGQRNVAWVVADEMRQAAFHEWVTRGSVPTHSRVTPTGAPRALSTGQRTTGFATVFLTVVAIVVGLFLLVYAGAIIAFGGVFGVIVVLIFVLQAMPAPGDDRKTVRVREHYRRPPRRR